MENEHEEEEKKCENEDGIRVVRELRMVSDSVVPSPRLLAADYYNSAGRERDLEMGPMGEGSHSSGKGTWNPSIEWDLGDFEFPDYKERMNAPI